MSKKKSHEEFSKEVFSIWGDSVELLSNYNGNNCKVLVRFKECQHECWKIPSKLLDHKGCTHKECRYNKLSKTKLHSNEWFIEKLKSKNLNYELLSDFNGTARNVTVKNLDCGHSYEAIANNILKGSGCPLCHGMKDTSSFKEIIQNKYPNEYEILGEYINNRTPIAIKHSCGYSWKVIPKDLLKSFRCPNCNKSLGEREVERFLRSKNLSFVCQYKFNDCIDKRPLPFDFAVFINENIFLIEFDGSQHYGISGSWGKRNTSTHKHDCIKNEYCKSNNIPLLRIPYWKIRNFEKDICDFLGIEM